MLREKSVISAGHCQSRPRRPFALELRSHVVDLPHAQLLAPMQVVQDGTALDAQQRVAAIHGDKALVRAAGMLPHLDYLWVSGVRLDAATEIGTFEGLRKLVVHDLRSPDLTAWSKLTQLDALYIAGSPKLRSLSGLEKLRGLRQLILFGCCRTAPRELARRE
jgi:hypothetical protein